MDARTWGCSPSHCTSTSPPCPWLILSPLGSPKCCQHQLGPDTSAKVQPCCHSSLSSLPEAMPTTPPAPASRPAMESAQCGSWYPRALPAALGRGGGFQRKPARTSSQAPTTLGG